MFCYHARMSTKLCDYTSVGTIIKDKQGRYALMKRAKFPIGIAPSAGHIDDHGTPEQAAITEVEEELGLIIEPADLQPTAIVRRRINNHCSRSNGDHHFWTVYAADKFSGDIRPDPTETKGAHWYTQDEIQALAERTRAFRAGNVPQADWEANPGLEEIWLDFLVELGYIQ